MRTLVWRLVCALMLYAAAIFDQVFAAHLLALAPDGKLVAYVRNDVLWLLSVHGKTAAPERICDAPTFEAMPRWSPAGDQLAYYSSQSGTLQLWIYDLGKRRSRRLTSIEGGINPFIGAMLSGFVGDPLRFSWSADGSKIAFSKQVPVTSATSGVAFPSVQARAAGAPIVLTTKTPREWTIYGVMSYGGGLAGQTYNAPERISSFIPQVRPQTTTQIFMVEVKTGKLSQLTHDDAGYFTPEWSPDGRYLAYMSAQGVLPYPYTSETNIFLLDLSTGRHAQISHGRSQKRMPLWSSDGQWIAYLGKDMGGTFARKEEGVYLTQSQNAAPTRNLIERLDRRLMAFQWADDGAAIWVTYWDGLFKPLSRVQIHTGLISEVSPKESVVGGGGSALAASLAGLIWTQTTDPNGPLSLWFQGSDGTKQMLREIEPAADPQRERRFAKIHWRNSRQETIDGMIVYPSNYDPRQKYPLIVDAYSMASLDLRLDGYANVNFVKAASNAVIFRPNHRAPHMWVNGQKGAVYDAAAVGPAGIALMADDVLSGLDRLIADGLIEPNRMCLVGFSNGGMQGLQLLTHTERFKCAVIQSPSPGDWLSYIFLSETDHGISHMYGIAPWEDATIYTILSPVFHVDKITTPVLLAAGDREGAVVTSIQIYNALRFLNKDITFLRYPDQGHGFWGAAAADFQRQIAQFLEAHL